MINFDIRNKKGLSDVVTTALIILLAIVAVVIVWSFVKPVIDKPAGEEAISCLKVDIKPVECDIDDAGGPNTITVESGSQSPIVSKVRFLYYDGNGNSLTDGTRDVNCDIGPLVKKTCDPAQGAGVSVPVGSEKVAIAAIINGNPCSPSAQIVC